MATEGGNADTLSDETFDLLCTVCKQKGRNTEADKFCTDCGDYYCSKCVKVHDTVPVLKAHKVADKGQFQKVSDRPLPVVPTERCDKHGLKPVDMFCETHDCVGCHVCMTVDHRLCNDIFYIPEYIVTHEETSDPREIKNKLDSSEWAVTEQLRRLEEEKQQTIKRKAESILKIRNHRKEIDERLNDLEQTSIEEVEKKYMVMTKKIEGEISVMNVTKNEVTSAKEKLATAGSNASQVFVMAKIGQKVATDSEKDLKEKRIETKEDISFFLDQSLSEVLNELKSLGKVVKQCTEMHEDVVAVKKNSALLQAKGPKKYDIKEQSDQSTCRIQSSCFLEDGTIILADNNNSNLKRLDRSKYYVRDHLKLPSNPWQMCAVSNQEVAVSYRQKEIMLVSIENQMKQKSLIKTDFVCCGLAYADNNLYISDRKTSVFIYSVSGRKLKQISLDQSGHPLFSSIYTIYSLAVSKDGSTIYVAHSQDGLVILDNNGLVLGRYNGQELTFATDVHLTSKRSVLVCGGDSKNILQFGTRGELIGEVIKTDNQQNGCWSVSCNKGMSKMIVGKSANEIEVYDFV